MAQIKDEDLWYKLTDQFIKDWQQREWQKFQQQFGYWNGFDDMARTRPEIIWDEHKKAYKFTFPYNKQFIDIFKKLVPSSNREWRPGEKCWYFTEDWLPKIKILVKGAWPYDEAFIFEKSKVEEYESAYSGTNANAASVDTQSYISNFAALVGIQTSEVNTGEYNNLLKFYRKAALKYHPDRNGGDSSKMSELNMIWNYLKEYYFIREEVEA